MFGLRLGRGLVLTLATLATTAMGLSALPAAAFDFKKIVDTSTLVPNGGGAFFNFNGSDVPAIGGDWVVFDTADQTVWRGTKTGKMLKRMVTTDNNIPGGWGKFHQFFGNYVQVYGDTVVLIADNCGGCGSGVGIFTRLVSGGPITKLVDKNDTNENFPGNDKHYGGFTPDFRVGENRVVFVNRQNAFSVPIAGGPVTAIAGAQDAGFSPPSPYCCLFSEPSIKNTRVFMRGGNVFGRSALQDVNRSGDPLSFRFMVTNAIHPPGTPAGYHFDDFEFWGPVLDETYVFGGASAAESKPYITGIYSRGSGFRKLVDTNTPVPGGAGNFSFAWFGTKSPIVASNGIIVFGAVDSVSGNPGLYAVSQSGGPITKIIAKGDPINGFTIDSLTLGREGLYGTTLVFGAVYAGFQGYGLYSTEVVLP